MLMKDMIADTRRLTYGSMADQLNFIALDVPADATELPLVMDLTGITPGMILSAGLNVYYVTNVIASEKKVEVYPGYDNSRSEALTAGTPVMIRPRATDWQLFNNLNWEITQLCSASNGLYKVASWTSPIDVTWQTYDVPVAAQGMVSLLRIRVRWPSTPDIWSDLDDIMFEYQQDKQLIKVKRQIPAASTLEFVYKDSFKQAAGLTSDIVVDCGMTETQLDIPPMGAAMKLLRTTESRRTQIHNQGDSKRADEVPPGTNSSAAREMERAYQNRVNDELARLISNHPIRIGL